MATRSIGMDRRSYKRVPPSAAFPEDLHTTLPSRTAVLPILINSQARVARCELIGLSKYEWRGDLLSELALPQARGNPHRARGHLNIMQSIQTESVESISELQENG
jgi:hypothetical protein